MKSTRPNRTEPQTVMPVIAEEVVVEKKAIKTGVVRVHKRVEEDVEHLDIPLLEDTVDVQRIAIGRVVDAPPPVRTEGDTVIVPVVEEEIVVTKRLVLKEEVHLIKRRHETRAVRDVTVRREKAEIEHLDAEGRRR